MRNQEHVSHIQSVNLAILLGFLAVALALIFWSVLRAESILAREDNPRLVEAELRLQRGRILDRNGVVLAETRGEGNQLTRVYPITNIGPAVGYYSFRHGTAGVEEGYDSVLRGDTTDFWTDFFRRLLHQPQRGYDIRLSLDARWQQTADELLARHAGALILLSLPDAEIRALVSHPAYDPNQLNERFESLVEDARAPLLNRVTQGQYQPGLVLQPLILAAAIEENAISLEEPVENPNRPAVLGGTVTRCSTPPPETATWADALIARCPGPMMELADRLGADVLQQIFDAFGLTTAPTLPLNTEVQPTEAVTDTALAGIGQDTLTVTPLQISLALAALATDGRLPTPRLVTAVQDETGVWQEVEPGETAEAISPQTAFTLRSTLAEQEGVVEHTVMVLSGPEGVMNGWYLGMAPATSPGFVVVVVVEDTQDRNAAQEVGRTLLAEILDAASEGEN